MISVRRILGSESLQLREIRLAALADSPSAFGSTHAEAVELPMAHWAERADSGANSTVNATFVAEDANSWVGLVGGYRESDSDPSIDLVSMWVAPNARGTGTARTLVKAVLSWAVEIEVSQVQLWVTVGNSSAEELYRSEGFAPDGEFQPLPSDPCKNELRMRRAL